MARQDHLFSLIKSLSKSEKRYFKLSTGLQGQQLNYLELFEAIEQMSTYDEGYLKRKFANRTFVKQLHVSKNYLFHLILRSLRNYQLTESANAQLKARLLDIEILFKRDLLRPCLKAIHQAEKLAVKIGDERSMLEVLNWKRKVLLNMEGVDRAMPELSEIASREKNYIDALMDESKIWDLTLSIRDRNSSGRQLLENPLIADPSRARTHRAKILQHHLAYVTSTMMEDPKKAEASLDQLINYLEGDIFKLKNDPGPYVTALNNKIGLYLNQRRHQLVFPLLKKIREIPERINLKAKSLETMNLLIRSYNVELETYRDSGKLSEALALIPKVEKLITVNEDLISIEYNILIRYQFACLFFMARDFSKSLFNINLVLGHRNHGTRGDIMSYGQFLNLILHFELGNYTVMKYSVDATRRFLKKRGGLLEFEKVLLRFFSQLSTRPQAQQQSLFKRCYLRLFGDPPLLNESQLDYLDFKYWLESRLSPAVLTNINFR